MATSNEELEDLVTCSVCWLEYNQDERKPKYLQCHHVVCLQCLMKIIQDNAITCPICRTSSPCPRGAVSLTTNTYILQLVELRKKLEQQSSRDVMWCLTCASLAGQACRKGHCTMDLTSKTEADCKDLNKALGKCRFSLTATISKKQKICHDLGKILDSLKGIENDIKGHLDKDHMQLAQMMSNLENLDNIRTSTETFQSVQTKIEAAVKFIEQEDHFMETSSITREMLNQISTRISTLLEFLKNINSAPVYVTPSQEKAAFPTSTSAASFAPSFGFSSGTVSNKTESKKEETSTGEFKFGASSHVGELSGTTFGGRLTFGGSAGPTGTTMKFAPLPGTDFMVSNDVQTNIDTLHQCISSMKNYKNKSLEELRYEDYWAGRKNPGAATTQPGRMFGTSTAQTGSFFSQQQQQKPLFGTPATSIIGTTQSTFGQQPQQQQQAGSCLFGIPVGFGQTTTSTQPTFAFGATQPAQPTSIFGTPAVSQSSAGTTTFALPAPPQTTTFGSGQQHPVKKEQTSTGGFKFGASAPGVQPSTTPTVDTTKKTEPQTSTAPAGALRLEVGSTPQPTVDSAKKTESVVGKLFGIPVSTVSDWFKYGTTTTTTVATFATPTASATASGAIPKASFSFTMPTSSATTTTSMATSKAPLTFSPPKLATPTQDIKASPDILLPVLVDVTEATSPVRNRVKSGRSPNVSVSSDNEVYEGDEGDHIHVEPIVPLPEKVEVKTGEEDEEATFCHRAKLLRLADGEWKERGVGDVKVLKHRTTGRFRLLMRREQVFKICLNHALTTDLIFKSKDERSWLWAARDFSEGEGVVETLVIRFRSPREAENFMDAIDKAIQELGKTHSASCSTPDESVQVVFETKATPTQLKLAADLKLPPNFFLYESAPPCPGCRGCTDESETPASAPVKTDASAPKPTPKAEETEPQPNTTTPSMASWRLTAPSGADLSFSTLATTSGSGEEGGKKGEDGGTNDTCDEPVVPLPASVEVKAVEEDEEIAFSHRAKLYRFDSSTKEWKERAVGEIKILHNLENKTYQILMRSSVDQIQKLACNHLLTSEMVLNPMTTSNKAWTWFAMDVSQGEMLPEQFTIHFKTEELAMAFKKKFVECQATLEQPAVTVNASAGEVVKAPEPASAPEAEESSAAEEEEENEGEDEETVMFEKRCTVSARTA